MKLYKLFVFCNIHSEDFKLLDSEKHVVLVCSWKKYKLFAFCDIHNKDFKLLDCSLWLSLFFFFFFFFLIIIYCLLLPFLLFFSSNDACLYRQILRGIVNFHVYEFV